MMATVKTSPRWVGLRAVVIVLVIVVLVILITATYSVWLFSGRQCNIVPHSHPL